MNNKACKILATLLIALGAFCSSASSHSGGTNDSGCHENRKTGDYHCHDPKSTTSSGSTRSTGSSTTSSSGTAKPSGWSKGSSPPVPSVRIPYDLKSASGLPEAEYQTNKECKKFAFSNIINQSERGYVRLRCGKVVMSIQAH